MLDARCSMSLADGDTPKPSVGEQSHAEDASPCVSCCWPPRDTVRKGIGMGKWKSRSVTHLLTCRMEITLRCCCQSCGHCRLRRPDGASAPLHRPSSMQVHHLTAAYAPKADFTSTRLELELRRATEGAKGA